MPIPIVCVVGRSKTGKTTLLEKLIPELKRRGYRVAAIKHHSHPGFEIDIPGKDSWRHAQAGSDHVIIEPLHALYRQTCLPAIAAHLAADERQVLCFFPDIRIRDMSPQEIEKIDPDLLSFFNVNTPQDWERALRLVQESHKVSPSARQPQQP